MNSLRDALVAKVPEIVREAHDSIKSEQKRLEKNRQRRIASRLKKIVPIIDDRIASVEESIRIRRLTAERVRTLKDAAHSALVTERMVSKRSVRFDVYNASKSLIRSVAIEGGDRYIRLLTLFKFSGVSRIAWEDLMTELNGSVPATATERTVEVAVSVR